MNPKQTQTSSSVRELPDDFYKILDDYIKELNILRNDNRRRGYLIQVLHKAQSIFGYLPEEVQRFVAEKLYLHHSDVSGVISFYNFFTITPKGKYNISICMGTACFVKGAEKIVTEFERILNIKCGGVTEDKKYSIDVLRCLGTCGLAPVVMVNNKIYGNVTTKKVGDIIADCKKMEG